MQCAQGTHHKSITLLNLRKCSEKVNPVILVDDTNLILSGINVDYLFSDMNCEPNKISLCFKANKLSLNLTNILYFIQPQKKKIFKRTTTLLANG